MVDRLRPDFGFNLQGTTTGRWSARKPTENSDEESTNRSNPASTDDRLRSQSDTTTDPRTDQP